MEIMRRVEKGSSKLRRVNGSREWIVLLGRVILYLRNVVLIRVTEEYMWNSKNDIYVAERLNQSDAYVCAYGLIVLIDEWTCPDNPFDRHVYMSASPKGLNIRWIRDNRK